MTFAQRLPSLLLVLATTAGATFTVLFAGGSGSLEAMQTRVTYEAMAAIALVPWLLVATFRPSWRPSSRLGPVLILALAVFLVASVTSRVPRLSLEMLAYAFLLVELYLILVALMRRPLLRLHFERLAMTLAFVVMGLYLVQVAQAWLLWWSLIGGLALPPLRPAYLGLSFGSPNPVATVVLLLAAFGLATLQLSGRVRSAAIVITALLVGVTTLITGSRGAWVGALAGMGVALVAAVMAQGETRSAILGVLRSRRAMAVLGAIVPVFAGGVAIAAASGRLTLEDFGYRAGFTAASVSMFQSSPLVGMGPGTWQVLRATFSEPAFPDLYIPHAHNVYLQTLAEFGVLGVVAGVALITGVARLALIAIRSGPDQSRRVGYAVAFTLGLLGSQQMADMLLNVPGVLLALALPLAWLDAASLPPIAVGNRPPVQHERRRGLVFATAALLTVVTIGGLIRFESITDTSEQGVFAASRGAWGEAAGFFAQAARADPALAIYQFELGVSAANSGDLRMAEASLSNSAEADDFVYAWLNLAAVRWKLGDQTGANQALERAERLGLQRTSVAVASGWLRQQLGEEPAAIRSYAAAMSASPLLAGDPFWDSPEGPSGGLEAVREALDEYASGTTRLQVSLVLDRVDDARSALASLRPSDPELYDLIIPAWNGEPTAWAALQDLASRRNKDFTVVGWARLVADQLRDAPAADRYATWLTILGSSENAVAATARIVTGSAKPLPPNSLDRYGSLYRRQVSSAFVIALLPQVVPREGE